MRVIRTIIELTFILVGWGLLYHSIPHMAYWGLVALFLGFGLQMTGSARDIAKEEITNAN
jgi:hypothetical protein